MLFETANQPIIMLVFCLAGFFCGFIFDFSNFLNLFFNQRKVTKHILNFFATVAVFTIFFLINLKMNYGEIRFYIFALFLSTIILQRQIFEKTIANIFSKCYTFLIKREKNGKKSKKEQKL